MAMKVVIPVLCIMSLFVCGCQVGVPGKLSGDWRKFTTADGLPSNDVAAVAVDGNGNVWFATDQGIGVMSAQGKWVRYSSTDYLGAERATDVLVDQRGHVWISTKGGGVSRFDGTTWQTLTSANSNLPGDSIRQLASDVQGNVWVLSTQGLAMIHDDTVTNVGSPVPEETLYSIAIGPGGRIWVATLSNLLVQYDPGEQRWHAVERIEDRVELPSVPSYPPTIWGIAADVQPGHLWIATNNIVEVEGETWQVHFPEYAASAVFVDGDGYKWFGVRDGLLLVSPSGQQWWCYRGGILQGIPDLGYISDITSDSQGNYWFATDSGAIRFTPAK